MLASSCEQAVETEAPATGVIRVPQWTPWVVIWFFAGLDPHDASTRAYLLAWVVYGGLLLASTALCLMVGARCRARARFYWFLVGFLTLSMASPRYSPEMLAVLALFSAPLSLIIVLARRLWFSQSFRGPWQRIYGHLTSALLLTYVGFFPTEFVREGSLDFLKNPLPKTIPLLWILGAATVAYRSGLSAPSNCGDVDG